jgi:hypothetical protein
LSDCERYSKELLHRLDGCIVARSTIVDMRLWEVEIETVPLRLVYEDFPRRHAADQVADAAGCFGCRGATP